jgi:hypothetical protein
MSFSTSTVVNLLTTVFRQATSRLVVAHAAEGKQCPVIFETSTTRIQIIPPKGLESKEEKASLTNVSRRTKAHTTIKVIMGIAPESQTELIQGGLPAQARMPVSAPS